MMYKSKRKRSSTKVYRQADRLDELMFDLPDDETAYKIVSLCDLTAAGFIRYVSDRAVIRSLDVSTFRIGPSALRQLRQLAENGRLLHARFVVGTIMEQDKRKTSSIKYWDDLCKMCEEYGWETVSRNNHTKLTLFDTSCGKFVLEGSCNLNEAPNWEQFSFCRDAGLYDFYHTVLDEMVGAAPAEDLTQGTAPEPKRTEKWGELPALF